jgi:hypothetical protein
MTVPPTTSRIVDRLLSPPLEEWRPDVPDLWPFCVGCGCDITVSTRYYIDKWNHVYCRACTTRLVNGTGAQP